MPRHRWGKTDAFWCAATTRGAGREHGALGRGPVGVIAISVTSFASRILSHQPDELRL
jgi:hypothetical protein